MKSLHEKVKLFFFLFVILSAVANAQTYPSGISVSAQNVVIPWNQSCANGTINISYWNNIYYTPSWLALVRFNNEELGFSGDRPTQVSFSVCSPGTYLIDAWLSTPRWGPELRDFYIAGTTVTVTKQSPPTYTLAISSPTNFYVNGSTYSGYANLSFTTGTTISLNADYSYWSESNLYKFRTWSDGVTSRSRSFTVNSNSYLSAIYYCVICEPIDP